MSGTPEPVSFGSDGTEGLITTAAAAGKATNDYGDSAQESLKRQRVITNHLTGETVGGNTLPGSGRTEK